MYEYWPWWLSALSLSFITISFFIMTRRSIGASGSWARTIMWRSDREIKRAEAPFQKNPKMFDDALMRATIQQFGKKSVNDFLASKINHAPYFAESTVQREMLVKRTPWTAHLIFLAMLSVGGFIATSLNGSFHLRWDLGDIHSQLFGSDVKFWASLFVGGLLAGFGSQMGRGCATGHGLHGCARLIPASLIATGVFFSTGVLVSFLVHLAA